MGTRHRYIEGDSPGSQAYDSVNLHPQVVLIISGNLSFLNWLTIVPSLACFDDAALGFLFPSGSRGLKKQVLEMQRENTQRVQPNPRHIGKPATQAPTPVSPITLLPMPHEYVGRLGSHQVTALRREGWVPQALGGSIYYLGLLYQAWAKVSCPFSHSCLDSHPSFFTLALGNVLSSGITGYGSGHLPQPMGWEAAFYMASWVCV